MHAIAQMHTNIKIQNALKILGRIKLKIFNLKLPSVVVYQINLKNWKITKLMQQVKMKQI